MSKPVTTAQWKKQGEHVICLPSGARVGIRIPDLPTLIEAGALPQTLLDAAIGYINGQGVEEQATPESIGRDRAFRDKLVQLTVVDPALEDADLPDVPVEDKDLIVKLALRQDDLDAEGEHIGGLNKSDKYRKFRGLDALDALLEGA